MTGSGPLTLGSFNTYTGNTTVNSGCSVALDSSGGLSFVVTDLSNNKVTGAGSATLDGLFTIDTSAVTLTTSSWNLVDTTTKSFGPNFSVAGFTQDGTAWRLEDGTNIWIFDTLSGKLTLGEPAPISYGPTGTGTLTFNLPPQSYQWTTASIAGGGGDVGSLTAMDSAVNTLAASGITDPVAEIVGNPTGTMPLGKWNSTDTRLTTLPGSNKVTCIMASLRNDSGAAVDVFDLGFTLTGSGTDPELPGYVLYYNLTGNAGDWVRIGNFGTLGPVTSTIPLTSSWANGATLYVLWADDNATGVTDSWYGIDDLNLAPPIPDAKMLTFGPGAIIDEPVGGVAAIAWTVPNGTDVTSLAPTFTLSYGATCVPTSGSTHNFTSPVDYTVTSSDLATVNVYTVTVTEAPPEALIWNVGSGTWDTSTPNWIGQTSSSIMSFFDGADVIFNNTAGGTITVTPNVAPTSTTVSAASGNYTFSGGPLAGSGPLTKSGGGTLNIAAGMANTFTGKTSILTGELALSAPLTNAGVAGPLGAPAGDNAVIDLGNNAMMHYVGVQSVTFVTDRPVNLAGDGEGIASIYVHSNDTLFQFDGPFTATGAGPKTLALMVAANSGTGDRTVLALNGAIQDATDTSPVSLHATFGGQDAGGAKLYLRGDNAFTGSITMDGTRGNTAGELIIGGSGRLAGGDYPGDIMIATTGSGAAKGTFNYASSADQILSGIISGVGNLTKSSGTGSVLTLSGLNTYTGNTTVSAGSLELASTGGLTFVVTDASNNKVTGAGSATMDGAFTIDTTAVTVTSGSWTLVDTATKSFGPNFSVAGFTQDGDIWKQPGAGSQIWIFDTVTGKLSLSGFAEIVSFGIPGSLGIIDQGARTIALTVPWVPWGTALATLNPTFSVSSGACIDQTSGLPPSPSFAAQNPATYTIQDTGNAVTNTYTVTVTVTPASTAKVMSNVYFAGYGYAWASDITGFNLLMVVPATADVSALAPTFSVSQFATCAPPSGTTRNFTTPQTYTVTAEDGSTQAYTVAVQKITATGSGSYQQKVLASGPVSYWPLNETSGTTAFDLATGLNNITYGGTYTLGDTGLRTDGNPSVLFTTATGAAYTGVAINPSLNPLQFTAECWVKPVDSTVQYLVSIQDRTTGGRTGFAIWKNNGNTKFGMQCGTGATSTITLNSTTDAVAGNVYHVVGTYDGSTFKLYVNGVLEGSLPSVYQPASAAQPGFSIGSRNGVTPAPSNIQDVALYTRALTQEEIQNHYQSTPGGFGTWASANAGGQTPGEDYDNDGVANGIEYFMGETGSSFTAMPGLDGTNTVTWTKDPAYLGTWQVQISPDLSAWTDVTGTEAVDGTSVSYQLPAGLGKQFVRLLVTPTP